MTAKEFLKPRARAKGLTLIALAEQVGISKGMMSFYLSGRYAMPQQVQDTIADILLLNEDERQLFVALMSRMAIGKTVQKAFFSLDSLLFGNNSDDELATAEQLILLLDKDRLMLSHDDFNKRLLLHAGEKNFVAHMRIVNGTDYSWFYKVGELIGQLFAVSPVSTVEHLITFSSHDQNKSITALKNVIPLMKYKNYSLLCSDNERRDEGQGIIWRSFYISTSYEKNGEIKYENFLFSVHEDQIECVVFDSMLFHEFITNDYFNVRKHYKKSILEFDKSLFGSKLILELERNYGSYVIKPNICYEVIPPAVYENFLARHDAQVIEKLVTIVFNEDKSDDKSAQAAEKVLRYFRSSYEATHKNSHIDVLSKQGMLDFVNSGRLSDHLPFLLPFDKNEIRMCLENIRDRNNDKNDDYKFYLTDKPLLDNGNTIIAIKGKGVLIEYAQADWDADMVHFIYVTNKTVTDTLSDYVESYVPENHVVSDKEATQYINWLIETYL